MSGQGCRLSFSPLLLILLVGFGGLALPYDLSSSSPQNAADSGPSRRTPGTPVTGFWNGTQGTGALPEKVPAEALAQTSSRMGGLPTYFSLNGYFGGTNYMTPVKNQGSCGSCWAFAAVGDMEAQFQINKGNPSPPVDLSEQNVLSCSEGTCSGWYLGDTLDLLKNSGTPDEACNPYVGTDSVCGTGRCSNYLSREYYITSWSYILTDTTNIKNYLVTHGPVMVWMPVFDNFPWYDANFWQNYFYGHSSSGSYGGHFVVIVGWDDQGAGTADDYWIVRNSWGTTGGDVNSGYGGYFYMTQDPANGFFGIYQEAAVINDVTSSFAGTFQLSGVTSDADGTLITVDGTGYTYPQLPRSFPWIVGSTHTISANSPVSCGSSCQYVWVSWSDGLAQSHSITPSISTTYTATFRKQYQLTIAVYPSGGGSTNPTVSSYWYDSGTSVPVSATVASGYSFYYWSLDGTNAGTSPSYSALMNSAHTLTAMFRGTSSISVSMSVAPDGFAWIISGTITPTQPSPGIPAGTQVALSYSSDSGGTWSNFITVLTSSAGDYSVYWQQPYQYADLRVRASWNGNGAYAGSTSSDHTIAGTYGPFYPPVSILVSGSSSVARGSLATFDVLVTCPSSYTLDRPLYIIVVGPDGYQYIDTVRAAVNAGETKRYQFVWQAPSSLTTGTYQVYAGLIPPNPAAMDQTQITVT